MARIHSSPEQSSARSTQPAQRLDANGSRGRMFGDWWDYFLVRIVFASACTAAGFHFHPFGLRPAVAAAMGLLSSFAVILFEMRLQRASMRRLIGAVVGAILGLLAALLLNLVLTHTTIPEGS